MDMKNYYDKRTAKKGDVYSWVSTGMGVFWIVLCLVLLLAWAFSSTKPISELLYRIFIFGALLLTYLMVNLLDRIIRRFLFDPHLSAMFVDCDGQIYCAQKTLGIGKQLEMEMLFRLFITAYRIADGDLTAPPPDMKRKEKKYVMNILKAFGKWIDDKKSKGLSVEQMSNISLTPIPTGGYEVEYTARFGDRFAPTPTRVTINPNYTDYDELVSLLEGFGK